MPFTENHFRVDAPKAAAASKLIRMAALKHKGFDRAFEGALLCAANVSGTAELSVSWHVS